MRCDNPCERCDNFEKSIDNLQKASFQEIKGGQGQKGVINNVVKLYKHLICSLDKRRLG